MTPHPTLQTWPRAAVFDCDGLLIDSAGCWEHAYARFLKADGASLADLDLTALAGASVTSAARHISEHLGTPHDEPRLRRLLRESFAANPPRPLPGAQALVGELAARLPLGVGVASNAPLEILDAVIDRLQLRAHLRTVVSAEETAADKPAPDVYLEACRRLGVDPSDAMAFEDSPLGARSARAAGLLVIAVPSAPELRIDADLTAHRLDDLRLLRYLGLSQQPADGVGSS